MSDHAGTQSRFYLFDALGNARSLLDPNGSLLATAAYTAYGTPVGAPLPSTPFGWQGQAGCYSDVETGLVYMEARYYAPSLGRFVSRDPIGFAGGINLYAYCGGDPINYWDPEGTDGIFGVPAGTVVGAGGYFLFTALSGGNPVIGALGGAAAGAAWSYFVDHKDIQTSLADGFTGALVSNGLDDVLIAGRAYFNYSSTPPAEAASEPAADAEDANSETLCRLRAKLDDPQVRRELVDPPTDRGGLRRNMGDPPFEGAQAHHKLPWLFKDKFAQAGLDVNDPQYGSWVEPHAHARFSYGYNRQWRLFFKNNPSPSHLDIINELQRLDNTGLYK